MLPVKTSKCSGLDVGLSISAKYGRGGFEMFFLLGRCVCFFIFVGHPEELD